jgi:hypothetical protein
MGTEIETLVIGYPGCCIHIVKYALSFDLASESAAIAAKTINGPFAAPLR